MDLDFFLPTGYCLSYREILYVANSDGVVPVPSCDPGTSEKVNDDNVSKLWCY